MLLEGEREGERWFVGGWLVKKWFGLGFGFGFGFRLGLGILRFALVLGHGFVVASKILGDRNMMGLA